MRLKMTKIIRVTGCHDCPYCRAKHICDKMHEGVLYSKKVVNKTLPDNCPLEDDKYGELLNDAIDWTKEENIINGS